MDRVVHHAVPCLRRLSPNFLKFVKRPELVGVRSHRLSNRDWISVAVSVLLSLTVQSRFPGDGERRWERDSVRLWNYRVKSPQD